MELLTLPLLLLLLALTYTASTNDECPLPRPHLSPAPLTPTWQASFPGSGSRMTWSLIQALSGLQTGDDFNTHNFGFANVVTVKTHYPVKTARNAFDDIDINFHKAIVLLRNPIHAIPSYFNLLYERKYHLPNHSTRGSNEEWIQYRDHRGHGLMYQIDMFEKFVVYWMERFKVSRNDLLLVSYEDLIDVNGADVTMRIVHFLMRDNGRDVLDIDLDKVECVWRKVVKFKEVQTQTQQQEMRDFEKVVRNTKANPHSLREGPRDRPYEQHQLEGMLAVLQRLMEVFSYDDEFVRIVRGYIHVVSNTAPIN
jgi:hypothetical protein